MKILSPEKLLLPHRPKSVRLFEGDLNDLLEIEIARAYERGREDALAGSCTIMGEAADRIDAARVEATREISAFATRFAASIAKHLIHIEIEQGNHAIEKMIRETLAESGVGRGKCVVHVHPEDARSLESVTFRNQTEIEADPDVARGSVHVSTTDGLLVRDVDACIQLAAERIHEDLRRQAHATTDSQDA